MADTNRSYEDGRNGAVFTGSTYLELQAFNSGRDAAAGAASMPAGGALIMVHLYALAAGCFWPVAGSLALGTLLWLRSHLAPPAFGYAVSVPLLLIGSALALWLGMRIEERLNYVTAYRRLRRLLRLVLMTALFTWLALNWRSNVDVPSGGVSLDWLLRQLSPKQIGMIIVGVAVAHVLSRRSDEKYEVWSIAVQRGRLEGVTSRGEFDSLSTSIAQQRSDDRLDRRHHRIRSGIYVGLIAALLFAVTGAPAGGVIIGGLFVGGLAAWFSRFIPRRLPGNGWLFRFWDR